MVAGKMTRHLLADPTGPVSFAFPVANAFLISTTSTSSLSLEAVREVVWDIQKNMGRNVGRAEEEGQDLNTSKIRWKRREYTTCGQDKNLFRNKGQRTPDVSPDVSISRRRSLPFSPNRTYTEPSTLHNVSSLLSRCSSNYSTSSIQLQAIDSGGAGVQYELYEDRIC